MLRRYNIKPILVFDGQNLPAKEPTEIKRHKYVRRHYMYFINIYLKNIDLHCPVFQCY